MTANGVLSEQRAYTSVLTERQAYAGESTSQVACRGTLSLLTGTPTRWTDMVLTLAPTGLLALYGLNETSGATATDRSGNGYHGTYTNMLLGQSGIGDGSTAIWNNHVDAKINIYSAGLAGAFTPLAFTIATWARFDSAARWTDGVQRTAISLWADDDNYINIYKIGATDNLSFMYEAGGTPKERTVAGLNTTGWMFLALTVSKADDRLRGYYALQGETLVAAAERNALGNWAGALATAVIGSWDTTPSSTWAGCHGPTAIWTRELTQAELTTLAPTWLSTSSWYSPVQPVAYVPRTWPATQPNDFTIAVLPDPQFYATRYPTFGTEQAQWIADNAAAFGVSVAIYEGDAVNDGDSDAEFTGAKAQTDILDTAAVPTLIVPGNHDYAGEDPTGRDLTKWNTTFPSTRYTAAGWFAGALQAAGQAENFYYTVTLGGTDYLFLVLEYDPRAAIVTWADGILTANAAKTAIIATHSFLNVDNARTAEGTALWNGLVKLHANVLMVLSGHMALTEDGAGYRVDAGDGGNLVHQVQCDYQKHQSGGYGLMRLLRFVPGEGHCYVETFTPHDFFAKTDSQNEFVLDY